MSIRDPVMLLKNSRSSLKAHVWYSRIIYRFINRSKIICVSIRRMHAYTIERWGQRRVSYTIKFSSHTTKTTTWSIGRDLAPSLGWEGTNFRMTFLGKEFHFNAENFWWPFLVIDRLLFVFCLPEIWHKPNMTLFLTKNIYFTKSISSSNLFLVTSYFPGHPLILLFQYYVTVLRLISTSTKQLGWSCINAKPTTNAYF